MSDYPAEVWLDLAVCFAAGLVVGLLGAVIGAHRARPAPAPQDG